MLEADKSPNLETYVTVAYSAIQQKRDLYINFCLKGNPHHVAMGWISWQREKKEVLSMGWDKTEHNAVIAMVTSGGKTEKDRMLAFFFFLPIHLLHVTFGSTGRYEELS